MSKKLWGGRFDKETDKGFEAFSASIGFDWRLWREDLRGSRAYAIALARAGLLTSAEEGSILQGLEDIKAEFERGEFEPRPEDEDIHTYIEGRLHELVGPVAGKLHTGRSRNDQVATDTRLYVMGAIDSIAGLIQELQAALVARAEENLEVIMPGYTHLQRAQPILLSHWFLAWFWMLERDGERLEGAGKRASILPLGSGALAGHPFGLDREFLARELGFQEVAENSLDAVSDRDFILEFLAAGCIIMAHLSRLAAELALWSTSEFAFVELDEAFSTGSSIMPQKKNPDSLELVRGKAGRVFGDLVSLLAMLKGLPLSYNRDLQEDKEPLFDAVDTLEGALGIMRGVVATLRVRVERMEAALDDYLLATDLADYLVRKSLPFREAHAIVGQLVRRSLADRKPLREISLDEFRSASHLFGPDVYETFDFRASVERKDARGGTSPRAVREQLAKARKLLAT